MERLQINPDSSPNYISVEKLKLFISISIFHTITIKTQNVSVEISKRPPYCDRGLYLVMVESHSVDCHIDEADMFPRYYFKFENCISEILLWLDKRQLQPIKTVDLFDNNIDELAKMKEIHRYYNGILCPPELLMN